MTKRLTQPGFTLLEVLICIAVIAVLLALTLPALKAARSSAERAVCGSNLRQLNLGWQGYLAEHKEQFPTYGLVPEWSYGGTEFVGPARQPVFATSRPINRYMVTDPISASSAEMSLFRCPGDAGMWSRGHFVQGRPPTSQLAYGTCYRTYGTSYLANAILMDSVAAGISGVSRPLFLHELTVNPSRLILVGDPAWAYNARFGSLIPRVDATLEARWHGRVDAGNALYADGSVRFLDFASPESDVTIIPAIR
ncbi:MAG: type II secretion system protein [Phycisphaerales bacterium]